MYHSKTVVIETPSLMEVLGQLEEQFGSTPFQVSMGGDGQCSVSIIKCTLNDANLFDMITKAYTI